jgi:hypothetical protein
LLPPSRRIILLLQWCITSKLKRRMGTYRQYTYQYRYKADVESCYRFLTGTILDIAQEKGARRSCKGNLAMPTEGKAAGGGGGDGDGGRAMQQAAGGASHRLCEWVAPDAADHVLRARALLSRAFSDGEVDDQVVSAPTPLGVLPTTLAALSSTPRSGADSGEHVVVPSAPATAPHDGRVDEDGWDEEKTGADDVPKLSMVDRLRKRGRVESVNFDHQHHVSRTRGHTGHNLGFRGFRTMANHGRLYPLERAIRKYGLHERASSSPDLVAEVRGVT